MMMTAMAISPTMRNVLRVATMLPTDVMASDTATIAPMIVPMIRRMSPLCAPGPLAGYGRAGPSRISRWAPQRPLEQPRSAQCKPPAMLTAGDSSRASPPLATVPSPRSQSRKSEDGARTCLIPVSAR
jgi:hypothetical protein